MVVSTPNKEGNTIKEGNFIKPTTYDVPSLVTTTNFNF